MLKKFVGLVAVGSFGFSLLAADDRAFIGTWKMNEAKSKFTNLPEAKGFTLVVTKEGDTVIESLKGTSGGQLSLKSGPCQVGAGLSTSLKALLQQGLLAWQK